VGLLNGRLRLWRRFFDKDNNNIGLLLERIRGHFRSVSIEVFHRFLNRPAILFGSSNHLLFIGLVLDEMFQLIQPSLGQTDVEHGPLFCWSKGNLHLLDPPLDGVQIFTRHTFLGHHIARAKKHQHQHHSNSRKPENEREMEPTRSSVGGHIRARFLMGRFQFGNTHLETGPRHLPIFRRRFQGPQRCQALGHVPLFGCQISVGNR